MTNLDFENRSFSLLHISDLHFCCFPKNPLHYLGYRGLTYTNYLLNPKRRFLRRAIDSLCEELTHNPNYILASGDFSLTGSQKEISQAHKWLEHAQQKLGSQLLFLPGNHDNYSSRLLSNPFYRCHFALTCQKQSTTESFFKTRCAYYSLNEQWSLILLDMCPEHAYGRPHGIFNKHIQQGLESLLCDKKDQKIILAGHWPMHSLLKKRNELKGLELLRQTCKKFSNIQLYLHGHTHNPHWQDLRKSNLPICIEAGSLGGPKMPSAFLYYIDDDKITAKQLNYCDERWSCARELQWRVNGSTKI